MSERGIRRFSHSSRRKTARPCRADGRARAREAHYLVCWRDIGTAAGVANLTAKRQPAAGWFSPVLAFRRMPARKGQVTSHATVRV